MNMKVVYYNIMSSLESIKSYQSTVVRSSSPAHYPRSHGRGWKDGLGGRGKIEKIRKPSKNRKKWEKCMKPNVFEDRHEKGQQFAIIFNHFYLIFANNC